MLVQAKQNDEDVHLLTQIFYYPSEIKCSDNKENFKLMQIDEELIKKLESGERYIVFNFLNLKCLYFNDFY